MNEKQTLNTESTRGSPEGRQVVSEETGHRMKGALVGMSAEPCRQLSDPCTVYLKLI